MKTLCARFHRRATRLRRLRTPQEWWTFFKVFAFAAAVPALFQLRLSWVSAFLERRTRIAVNAAPRDASPENIIQSFDLARDVASPLISSRCLVRAVTLFYFLRRAGLDLRLCFGLPRAADGLPQRTGHCWLIKNGAPYLESVDPRIKFIPIYWLPDSHNPPSRVKGGE